MGSAAKKTMSSSSPTLSDDLLISIFMILPPQDLLRCQSVCKPWYDIINSAFFIETHLNRPKNKYHLLTYPKNFKDITLLSYLDKPTMITTKPYPFYPTMQQQLTIVGCVRGILCFFNSQIICFWNPYTRKSKTIPNPSNPSITNQHLGFEFVTAPSEDFKLVRLVSKPASSTVTTYEVDVYIPRSDSWKRIDHNIPNCTIHSVGSEVTVRENVHWRATFMAHDEKTYNFILGFDVNKEAFRRIDLPTEIRPSTVGYRFVNGDNLLLCAQYPYMNFNIWVMKDYGVSSTWVKLFSFDSLMFVTPFEFINNYKELLAVSMGGSLIVYDHNGRGVDKYLELFDDRLVQTALTYRESLEWFEKKGTRRSLVEKRE